MQRLIEDGVERRKGDVESAVVRKLDEELSKCKALIDTLSRCAPNVLFVGVGVGSRAGLKWTSSAPPPLFFCPSILAPNPLVLSSMSCCIGFQFAATRGLLSHTNG